jgi:MFS family permease
VSSIWQPPLRRLTLGLSLVVVATAFEALAVATILPTTVAELGGLEFYGWTFSAFMLAHLVGISLGGSESERVGSARLFLLATLLFVAGLCVSGSAPSMLVIVAGRVLQGLGAGLLSTLAYAAIAQAYAVDLQPRMLATLSSAWVVPGLVGPGVAALVVEHVGWRWVFLGLAPLPLAATLLVLPALRAVAVSAPAADGGGRGQTWLALQLGLGAAALQLGVELARWCVRLPLALAGALLAARALARLLPAGSWRARPGLPAAVAAMLLVNFAFFGSEAFLPLALDRVRGAPVGLAGLSLTAAALSWTTGAWLPIQLGARYSRRAIIGAGIALLALGIGGIGSLLWPAVPSALSIAAWAVSGLGMGLAFTTLSAAILETGSGGHAGQASAALQLAQVIGVALSTGAGGAIVAARFAGDPPRLGIALVDALMLLALGLCALAARGVPNQAR